MTHPLTDDIIESELATPTHFASGSLVGLFTHDDMRAAADWQLEQVIEWLYDNLYWVEEFDHYQIIEDLKEAMRPQQQEES